MNMAEDATGTTLLRFGEQETIRAPVDVLRAWVEAYEVSRPLYTDWRNVDKRPTTSAKEAAGEAGHTSFGRICATLGIEIIAGRNPAGEGAGGAEQRHPAGSADQEDAAARQFG